MCKTATMKTLMTTTMLLAFLAGATQGFALIQETKLTASDPGASDNFGYAVSTDGHYAIAGAYRDDGAAENAGAAYIFERVGNSWITPGIKLTASEARKNDYFGCSVSIDGSHAIVGAYQDDHDGMADSGSARVFQHSTATGWTEQTMLTASDAAAGDNFGNAVSIRGDYAIVGAQYCSTDSPQYAGAAYIFKQEATGWSQQAKLTATTPTSWNFFGNSVAIDGNYAIVGEENCDTNTGAAYIFERSGETWSASSPTKLVADDDPIYFGHSVSIDGDYAIVGAYYDQHDSLNYAGSAYIFHRSEGIWSQQAKLTASDAAASDLFGCSVSISGDYAVVGAYGDDVGGSAYVFYRSGETWYQTHKLTASDAAASDDFGCAVSVCGEYGMVGAYKDDDGASSAGSAYVFHPIPEPGTIAMLLMAAASLLLIRRTR